VTTIRLDRYLNLGNSKFEKERERSAYRFARIKALVKLTGKSQRIFYKWLDAPVKHYVEYDAASSQVLAIVMKAEKVVWEAKKGEG
tara:strand:+ start:69 stop:326 length:258 start_codon:yes stop_codon:yes gene_type:complete